MTIKYTISRNRDNVKIMRADAGLRWAQFDIATGALIQVGSGICEPTEAELAEMVAAAPAQVATLAAAHIAQTAAAKQSRIYQRDTRRAEFASRGFDNRRDMRSGADLSRAMSYEDSAL